MSVSVILRAPHSLVAGTQNDLQFDPVYTPIAARDNGKPDCVVNPDINKAATSFAFRPNGCRGTECTSIRALVLSTDNVDPIIDGSALYSCTLNVAAISPNGLYPLTLTGVILASPEGDQIPGAYGVDGGVIVGD